MAGECGACLWSGTGAGGTGVADVVSQYHGHSDFVYQDDIDYWCGHVDGSDLDSVEHRFRVVGHDCRCDDGYSVWIFAAGGGAADSQSGRSNLCRDSEWPSDSGFVEDFADTVFNGAGGRDGDAGD